MLIRGQFEWQIHNPNPALVAPKGFTTAQLCLLQEAFSSDSCCRSLLPQTCLFSELVCIFYRCCLFTGVCLEKLCGPQDFLRIHVNHEV